MLPKPVDALVYRDHPMAAGLVHDQPFADPGRWTSAGDGAFSDRITGYTHENRGTGWAWRVDPIYGIYVELSGGTSGDHVRMSNWFRFRGNGSMMYRGSTGGFWSVQVIVRSNQGGNNNVAILNESDNPQNNYSWWRIRTNEALRITTNFNGGGAVSITTGAAFFPIGEWINLVVTFDENRTNELWIYKNGRLDTTGTVGTTNTMTSDAFVLGAVDTGIISNELQADYALFRCWQRTLHEDEIWALYEEPYSIYYPLREEQESLGLAPAGAPVGHDYLSAYQARRTWNPLVVR